MIDIILSNCIAFMMLCAMLTIAALTAVAVALSAVFIVNLLTRNSDE